MVKLRMFKSLLKRINNLFELASVFLFCLVILLVFTQVVFRYVLRNPLTWIEEVTRFFFIWLVFIGSSVAHYKLMHPRIDLFIEKLPGVYSKAIIEVVADFCVLGFLLIMLIAGCDLTKKLNLIRLATTRWSLSFMYIPIPIAMGMMIINQIKFLAEKLVKLKDRRIQ